MSTGSYNSDNQNSRVLQPWWVSHTRGPRISRGPECQRTDGDTRVAFSAEARVASPKSLDLFRVFLVEKGLGTVRFPHPES